MIAVEPTVGLSGINWNTIILGIIGLMGTAVSGVIAIYIQKLQQLQKEAKADVNEVKHVLAESTTQTNVKLDVIHAITNSSLTASMESDENSQSLNIVMMEEMLNASGRPASVQAAETLAKAKGRVEALRKSIAERKEQQAVINAKIAEGSKPTAPQEVIVVNTEMNPAIVDPVKRPTES